MIIIPNSILMCRYSSCVPITAERTRISVEFMMVECENTGLFNQLAPAMLRLSSLKYRMFHGSAFAAQRHSNSTVKRKEKFWTTNKEEVNVEEHTAPPNILILGQDSTSRLNFRRHMKKTLKILESLGSVEMLGYSTGILN
jgi:hypothetical protein